MLDSDSMKNVLRKAVAAIVGCVLAVLLLTSLCLAGIYLLLRAMTAALLPVWGEAGALAATGAVCLLLVGLALFLLSRPARIRTDDSGASAGSSSSPVNQLRKLIRNNPLESAMVAFSLGVVEQSDPRLKALLLQGGMELFKPAAPEASANKAKDPPADA